MTAAGSGTEAEMLATAQRLSDKRRALGAGYWRDDEVLALQRTLRRLLGAMGGWSADGPPMHRRGRALAQYERRFAPLLWPGQGGDDAD